MNTISVDFKPKFVDIKPKFNQDTKNFQNGFSQLLKL